MANEGTETDIYRDGFWRPVLFYGTSNTWNRVLTGETRALVKIRLTGLMGATSPPVSGALGVIGLSGRSRSSG